MHSSKPDTITAERGRYHLYMSHACPYSARAVLARCVTQLTDVVSMSSLHPVRGPDGWVFADGEYRGSEDEPASIEEALENMDADGTASILDIDHIAKEPEPMGLTVLAPADARRYFGTERPIRADVERADEFWEDIGRGEAICVVLYNGERPSDLYFAGCSFD